jgi:uncharacterized membrane protein YtjA (UPF0391 family)
MFEIAGMAQYLLRKKQGRTTTPLMYWAFLFLVIAIVAAIFGFGIAATASATVGKILSLLFLIGFVVRVTMSVGRGSA